FVSPVKKAIPLLAHHAEILAEIVLDDPSGLHAASKRFGRSSRTMAVSPAEFNSQGKALQPPAGLSVVLVPVSSSRRLRPAWHLLQQLRLDECCDSRCSTWTARPSVEARHRSVPAYLTQIPCPS